MIASVSLEDWTRDLFVATLVLAVVTLVLAGIAVMAWLDNKTVVRSVRDQADAIAEMTETMKFDRDLAHRPYLLSRNTYKTDSAGREIFRVSNAGRGAALSCELVTYSPGPDQWYQTVAFQLLSGENREIEVRSVGGATLTETMSRGPEMACLSELQRESRGDNRMLEVVFCQDQFGKLHRFQHGKPEPLIWEAGRWIAWSTPYTPR